MAKRTFSREVKLRAVRRLQSGERASDVSRSVGVDRGDLYRWRREYEEHGDRAFCGGGFKRVEEDQIAQLERKVGQQALEIDFLQKALQRVEEERQLRAMIGARSTNSSPGKSKTGRR